MAPTVPAAYRRTRLLELLDVARRTKQMTWIAAPAGAGKTTLVASYLDSRNVNGLWYQVDAGDADLASFFHYLGLAVKQAAPRFRRPPPSPAPGQLGDARVFARHFFRELGRRVRAPFVLVFDDLQEADADGRLHDLLVEGLSQLPQGGHAVLISRAAAPAAFARLRLHRRLAEIDWPQLRLDADEARALVRLAGREADSTPDEAADSLHRRCEGWIAGLLLLLEVSPPDEERTQAMRLPGAQPLFDYFAAEVFRRRPPAVRDFLMLAALFPRFTARMAARLTGYTRSSALLDDLVRQHHFTERRSESWDSYQFHPLFREFLLAQAGVAWGDAEIAHQRQRAATILEDAKQFEDAAALYTASGNSQAAARLILARAHELAAAGRYATIGALIERLPASYVARDPWLRCWRGLVRSLTEPAQARPDLEAAYFLFDAAGESAGLYLAWASVVETYFAEYRDYTPVDRWITAFASLRERFPEFPSAPLEARVLNAAAGALQQRLIDHPLLSELVERLEGLIAATPDPNQRVRLGMHPLLYHMILGDVDRARGVAELIGAAADERRLDAAARLTRYNCLALLEWYVGEPRAALRYVEKGLELVDAHGLPPVLRLFILNQGIHSALARGDEQSASAFLEQIRVLVVGRDDIHAAVYHHYAAVTAAHRDDLAAAEKHGAASVRLSEQSGVLFGHFINLYSFANILLMRGDRESGAATLAAAHAVGAEKGSRYMEFLCRLSRCAFGLDDGEQTDVLAALREALALSRGMGGPAVPWLPHRLLARMYAKALEHGIETEHVENLIRKLEVCPTDEVLGVDAWPWPIKVYTLGRFSVLVDGASLKFSTKAQTRPLELLKTLIAFGGRNVREDRIIRALWPDAEADRAAFNLTTTVHRLRKLLGDQAIERQERRLTLNRRVCWVDAWAVERLAAVSEEICRTGSPESIAALADKLLLRCHGLFLEDHDELPWLLSTRERIRGRFLRALGSLADALTRAQRYVQAARCLQRALETDPLAEDLYRQLMLAQLARGRRSEALATYGLCRQTLAAHFGLEPSSETEAIRRRILDSDLSRRESG